MTERGMLFSAPMVRALLAGTKTQTRRAVKPKHDGGVIVGPTPGGTQAIESIAGVGARVLLCPYGLQTDRIWVRETFARIDGQSQPWIETDYRATYTHGDRLGDSLGIRKKWTPAIHMPRAASRITLEITEVRVERLQDISEADAIAEGVHPDPSGRDDDDFDGFVRVGSVRGDSFPIARYAALWESINGPGSWGRNPWVWVVSFRRIKP